MPEGDIQTFYEDGQWHSRVEGQEGLLRSYEDKEAAVAHGARVARDRKVEHIIKELDGTIGERNNYGHDPRNVSGNRI
jgi:hypothetical protein